MTREVRLDRMRPADLDAAMARAPVAWLPLGAIGLHAPHLPLGTDSLTASHVLTRAAEELGGVVLPHTTLTLGAQQLPWSMRYDAALVAAGLRSTIAQLAAYGAQVVVVHTGQGSLDVLHLIKRVCREAEDEVRVSGLAGPGFRAYGLCYLELNAALGAGLGTDWPTAFDHGSITETSWVMAIDPTLVDLDALPPELAGPIVGVDGPHPRGRASADFGGPQIGACVTLLVDRVRELVRGGTIDTFADLWTLVERYWTEDLEVTVLDPTTITLRNPGALPRYLTSARVLLDGVALDTTDQQLVDPAAGEVGIEVPLDTLGAESGFLVRHDLPVRLLLPEPLPMGEHRLSVEVGLAAVAVTSFDTTVTLA